MSSENTSTTPFETASCADSTTVAPKNDSLQRRSSCSPRLSSLHKAVELAQGAEATEKNARKLKAGDADAVCKIGTSATHRTVDKSSEQACYRCGGTNHVASVCRFKDTICHKCKKKGHLAKVCRGGGRGRTQNHPTSEQRKSTHTVQESAIHAEEEPANFTLFRVGEARSHGPIVVTVEVNQQPLEMELDTGAAVCIISTSTKDQMFTYVPLISTSTILTTYTGEQMAVAGKMEVEVRYGEQSAVITLHVVEGVGANLLGRDWLGVLKLDWASIRMTSVDSSQKRVEALLHKYQEVFKEALGKMKTFEASLRLKPEAKPRFHKARSVPFALKEAIERELDHLEAAGIVEKVTHSKWTAPIVPVPKEDPLW